MFLMSKIFCSFKFTLCVLIYLNVVALFSHGSSTSKVEKKKFHILHFHSPVFNHNCSAHKTGKVAHKMELLYAYGPCSPFPNSVQVPSRDKMLLRNEGRVRRINGRNPNSQSPSTMGESDGKSLEIATTPLGDSDQYITTIGLGTPKIDYKVMIDTGSDISWVRCTPCLVGCTPSLSPLYDPLRSLSYRNGSTEFNAGYGDRSSASGIWSYDKLTLQPNQVIKGFKFGCGQKNVAKLDDFARAAGVLGLGRGDSSLVSQSTNEFGKVFGYCLPKSQNSGGYLLFGDEATRRISSSSTLQFTQLLNDPPALPGTYLPDSLYFLQLVGISVAGNKLNVSPDVFTSVGTTIDTGTVVSHLPKEAYAALSSAFNQSMLEYQRAPPPGGKEVLDTCFVIESGRSMVIPSVTFHFAGGTDVDLDESGIGWTSEKGNIWCLGFTASENESDLTIIGNTQQREMEILFDIDGGKIGFSKTRCGG